MAVFHFNRRDVSFRHNLDAIDGQEATLVSRDRKKVYFTHAKVGVDEVSLHQDDNWNMVYHEEEWWTVELREIEMVIVEVE